MRKDYIIHRFDIDAYSLANTFTLYGVLIAAIGEHKRL